MAIVLKSPREIELMRKAGIVVSDVLLKLKEMSGPGVTTAKLNEVALDMTRLAGGEALFKGVRGPGSKVPFPGAICTSINEQLVHGIPSEKVVLCEGDILSIDYGVRLGGYCADAAVTFGIGGVSREKQRLMDVTKEVLGISLREAMPKVRWSQIAGHIQSYVESAGFSVVKDFVGHGIGTKMHEEPRLPNFVSEELLRNDVVLTEGMVIAVEPMVNAGGGAVMTLGDGWTVVTKDGRCSAHFEHTIAIVEGGCEILTVPIN
jgi:methionyl aminopeptidase